MVETTTPEYRWDGTNDKGVKLSDGTYYYILKATTYTGKVYEKTGYIQLLRNN